LSDSFSLESSHIDAARGALCEREVRRQRRLSSKSPPQTRRSLSPIPRPLCLRLRVDTADRAHLATHVAPAFNSTRSIGNRWNTTRVFRPQSLITTRTRAACWITAWNALLTP
jgi:hypothetical protein